MQVEFSEPNLYGYSNDLNLITQKSIKSNKVYFVFSSITFLQFYIPLVKEARNRGYETIFLIRENLKDYANPYSTGNFEILKQYLFEYYINCIFINNTNKQSIIPNIDGIVFMIDGDIYGPPRQNAINDSMLYLFDRTKTLIISMTEHMNFWAVYRHFIDHIDYAFFSNEYIIKQMSDFTEKNESDIKLSDDTVIWKKDSNYNSPKNIFIGNTKFDNIPDNKYILEKFKLDPISKYCLFLFPKIRDNFKKLDMLRIYEYVRLLGFKIIVKTRPKDRPIPEKLKGDLFVCSDIYPNESLELMRISSLCLISSSSANEEALFSKIPCIDLVTDLRPWERNQYLLDDKIYRRI